VKQWGLETEWCFVRKSQYPELEKPWKIEKDNKKLLLIREMSALVRKNTRRKN